MIIYRSLFYYFLCSLMALSFTSVALAADFEPDLSVCKSFKECEPLAESGNAGAQFNLGFFYDDFQKNKYAPLNYKNSAYWYHEAAKQGHGQAANNLALLYLNGYGVEKSKEKAFEWYRASAEAGNVQGQNNLARAYSNGTGVAVDHEKALLWWEKAAAQNHPKAMYNIALQYYHGRGKTKQPWSLGRLLRLGAKRDADLRPAAAILLSFTKHQAPRHPMAAARK